MGLTDGKWAESQSANVPPGGRAGFAAGAAEKIGRSHLPFTIYHCVVIRPTVARIDLAAVKSNLTAIAEFVRAGAPGAPRIIAVVKANAYGHGAAQVGVALEEAGAAMLACADIEEGIVLREAGVRAPILVFGALSVSDLDGIFTHGDYINYKDVRLLAPFLPERGKIQPRRISGTCAMHQRKLQTAIKRARQLALIPYVTD